MHKHLVVRIKIMCLAIFALAVGGRCQGKTAHQVPDSTEVRKPVVAGAFYPEDAHRLAEQVDQFLAQVSPKKVPGRLIGLVVPHAGYVFSGHVAADAYRLLQGKSFDRVILIGCSHRARFQGASIYPRGSYETPLGRVPVDAQMAGELISQEENFHYLPEAHLAEHSLEVQLPFLQRTLDEGFRILPVVIGPACPHGELEAMARAILQAVGDDGRVLLVASTDLSHYPSYESACLVDGETVKILEQFDPQALAENEIRWRQEDIPELSCAMCSGEAVMVAMMVARGLGADGVEILKYANSGDVPIGDHQRVVGYCAAAFYQEAAEGDISPADLGEDLNRQEQEELLDIAREAISKRLAGERYAPSESQHPRLVEKRGAFVTLHKNGQLRGCIGNFQPGTPLCQTVARMAQAAAFEDGRFQPLSSDELNEVEIEISVLSPLREISSIDEIELGKHGIWITRGRNSGCFLPQVATETGWSKQEFLEHCCRDKAFLQKDAYLQEDTHIYVFTALVFDEE